MSEQNEYADLRKVTDEQYHNAMEDMFASEGWHLFLSELYATSVHLNDLQAITTQSDLDFTRGKLSMIGFCLNYQDIMNQDSDTKEDPSESP